MRISRIIAAVLLGVSLIIAACASTQNPPSSPPPPPKPGPTGFLTSNLQLPTLDASAGDAKIMVTVTNTGNVEATHDVKMFIDGQLVATKTVDLAGGASQVVTFETILEHAGTHNVTIDQVSGKLDWAGPN